MHLLEYLMFLRQYCPLQVFHCYCNQFLSHALFRIFIDCYQFSFPTVIRTTIFTFTYHNCLITQANFSYVKMFHSSSRITCCLLRHAIYMIHYILIQYILISFSVKTVSEFPALSITATLNHKIPFNVSIIITWMQSGL